MAYVLGQPDYPPGHTPSRSRFPAPPIVQAQQPAAPRRESSATGTPSLSQVEQEYFETLVQYYYKYAAQGLLAPISDERQSRARAEAVRRAGPIAPPVSQQHHPSQAARPASWHHQQGQQSRQDSALPQVRAQSPAVSSTPFASARPLPRPASYAAPSAAPHITQPGVHSNRHSVMGPAPTSWDEIGTSLGRAGGARTQSDVGMGGRQAPAGQPGSRSDVGMTQAPLRTVSEVGTSGGQYGPAGGARRAPLPLPPGAPQRSATLPTAPPAPFSPSGSPTPRQGLPPLPHVATTPLPTAARRALPSPAGSPIVPPIPQAPFSPEDALRRRMSALSMSSAAPPTPPPSRSPALPLTPTISVDVPNISSPTSPAPARFSPSVQSPSIAFSPHTSSLRQQSASPALHPRSDPSHPSHPLYHPAPSSSSSAPPLEAGTVRCKGCQEIMYGRALMAAGGQWHPDCFRCAEGGCDEKLEHVQFEEAEDKVWCMVHYEEKFAKTCFHCHTPIADDSFLTVTDTRLVPPTPTTRTYHALHFFCASCGDPFVDPKSLSPAKGREEAEAAPYMVHKGYAYCEKCDLRLWREKCTLCRKGVGDEWVEPGGPEGGKWHQECFVCSTCTTPLAGNYLIGDDDLPYCFICHDLKALDEAHQM